MNCVHKEIYHNIPKERIHLLEKLINKMYPSEIKHYPNGYIGSKHDICVDGLEGYKFRYLISELILIAKMLMGAYIFQKHEYKSDFEYKKLIKTEWIVENLFFKMYIDEKTFDAPSCILKVTTFDEKDCAKRECIFKIINEDIYLVDKKQPEKCFKMSDSEIETHLVEIFGVENLFSCHNPKNKIMSTEYFQEYNTSWESSTTFDNDVEKYSVFSVWASVMHEVVFGAEMLRAGWAFRNHNYRSLCDEEESYNTYWTCLDNIKCRWTFGEVDFWICIDDDSIKNPPILFKIDDAAIFEVKNGKIFFTSINWNSKCFTSDYERKAAFLKKYLGCEVSDEDIYKIAIAIKKGDN